MDDDEVDQNDERDNGSLSPPGDEEIMSCASPRRNSDSISHLDAEHVMNISEHSNTELPGNNRRRRRPDGLSNPRNLSSKPVPAESQPHSHLGLSNSIMSIDWSKDESTSDRAQKNDNLNASLIFDDDLSLSLHQAVDDEKDREESMEKKPTLEESSFQLSGVCTIVDGILANIDNTPTTTTNTTTNTQQSTSTTSPDYAETDDSSSSHSSQESEGNDEDNKSNAQLWGREKELSELRSRYFATTAKISHDNSIEFVPSHAWVSGVSGIGKTSLVDTFLQHKKVVETQPIICRGVFEENWINTSKPFPGITSCLIDLFHYFLNRDDTEEWAERIFDCLDNENDVELVVSLIPSLAILLDVDNDDTKYSFEKSDRYLFGRLSRALGRIIVLICEYSPVIFFLDDVHWAGEDSLQLLKSLLQKDNLRNFFFIGCHRSGIKVAHSLHKIKSELSESFGADIKVGGIGIEHATSLVHSHLCHLDNESSIDAGKLDSIMKSWYRHASSRIPIFLEHLIHRQYEKGDLKVKKGKWKMTSRKDLPPSSLSLVVERIENLPNEYDVVLKSAALLDTNAFDLDMLTVAMTAMPKSQTIEMDIEKVESIINILVQKKFIKEYSQDCYSFAHDVVKVAASSRIPITSKKGKSRLHWRLATDLKKLKEDNVALRSDTKSGLTSLLIANHFNKGILSVEDKKKSEQVVKLYLQAAEAAMKISAFSTASNLLDIGLAALDKKSKWEESYNLTLKTYLALARCLYCTGEQDKARSILNTLIANGKSSRDTIDAFELLVLIYRSKMQYEQAKQCGLKALNDIWGEDINDSNVEEKFSKVREFVQKKSDADLLVLPDLEHKKTAKKMMFLLQLAESSGLCRDYKLQDLAALRMVELTIKYGSHEVNFTGLAFALFGVCVARRHLYGEAYRYGRLAEMISEKDNSLGRQAIAYHNYYMRHWRNNIRGSRKPLKDICRTSIEENEIENISFQVGVYLSAIFYTGTPFDLEDTVMEEYFEIRQQFELPENWNIIAPYNALMKLKGENSGLIKRKYTDTKAIQYDLFFQMVVSVFMNDMDKAEKLNEKIFMKPGGCWGSYRLFMEGLIATHYARSTNGRSKLTYQKKASKFIEILRTWTKVGMHNSAHMANILKVELMISSDKGITSKRLGILLDTAISSAHQDGFPHHAALASERAGAYFLFEDENEKLASKYLSRASAFYAEWGAVAKVKQLESGFGEFLIPNLMQTRGFKKDNSIPLGSLMFTDQKDDQGASMRSSRRSSLQHTNRSPVSVRPSRRSSLHTPVNGRRSLSSDSPMTSRNKIHANTPSLHARSRKVPLKPTSASRSKSLTQRIRPSLVSISSWESIKSNISNISDDLLFEPKKKKSSTPTQTRRKRPSFQKTTKRPLSASQQPGGESEKKIRGRSAEKKTLTLTTPKKKSYSGPKPSPKPRKSKILNTDDTSYLFNYDTDDFDTVNGSSEDTYSPEKNSEKSEASPKKRPSGRSNKKKKKVESPNIANDMMSPSTRRSRKLKSKTLTL